jgi:hypothetical protein
MVNGQPIRCQVSVMAVAVGSKPGQDTKDGV